MSASHRGNVKVEPRSNNAIAAGMAASYDASYQAALASSSAKRRGTKTLDAQGLHHSGFDVARGKSGIHHHQKLDVTRHPEKARATHRKLRAKDRPLTNDFISDADFAALLAAWFGNASRVLHDGGQRRPQTSLEQDHPDSEQHDVDTDERHRPRERGDLIRDPELHALGSLAVQAHDDRMSPAGLRLTGVMIHGAEVLLQERRDPARP